MSKLLIYQASAGAGKTYTLTLEYIQLLFENPHNYKNTLAVTFTNKATEEMKSRIMEKLYLLATAEKPDYLDILTQQFNLSEKEVRKTARTILQNLLHDYARFSISTIDSFFQKVIRSFAREAGLNSNFKVELDSETLIQQAVDLMMLDLGKPENRELREWIFNVVKEKIEDGSSWDLSKDMRQLAKQLFSESIQNQDFETIKKITNKENLHQFKKKLQNIAQQFENQIKAFGSKGLQIIQNNGLTFDDFKGKSRSKVTVFKKWSEFDKDLKIDNALALLDNQREWFTQSPNPQAVNCFNSLNDILREAIPVIETEMLNYNTAKVILKNIGALGIMSDIAYHIQQISHNENLFLLANSNQLLNKIIADNESPFIYEKTGAKLNHFMIDEFQDTSRLQWENFKPLINNSLSEGNKNLVVGDVKQSIYRFRNSDWRLLGYHIYNEVAETDNKNLDSNYRSSAQVIDFNNQFFKEASLNLQNYVNQEFPDNTTNEIIDAYQNIKQIIPPSKQKEDAGIIEITQFYKTKEKEESKESIFESITRKIDFLLSQGFKQKEITILVRNKKEGRETCDYLLSKGNQERENDKKLVIISNESLYVSSSSAVIFIIETIKYLLNPNDQIAKNYISVCYHQLRREQEGLTTEVEEITNTSPILLNGNESLPESYFEELLSYSQLPLFELVEKIIEKIFPDGINVQSAYVQSFLNLVAEYISGKSSNINTFIQWWEEKGFEKSIDIPEDQDAIKIITIHKSKGLEFKAVLIPFCNWELKMSNSNTILWCAPKSEPFLDVPFLPIKAEDKLKETIFREEYKDEFNNNYIDNINLLYVAFTRAKDFLWIGIIEEPKLEKIIKINHLIQNILENTSLLEEDEENSNDVYKTFTKGKKFPSYEKRE